MHLVNMAYMMNFLLVEFFHSGSCQCNHYVNEYMLTIENITEAYMGRLDIYT